MAILDNMNSYVADMKIHHNGLKLWVKIIQGYTRLSSTAGDNLTTEHDTRIIRVLNSAIYSRHITAHTCMWLTRLKSG